MTQKSLKLEAKILFWGAGTGTRTTPVSIS